MNTNINSTLRLALLFCYLFILSEQALGQAFVMGKYPAYTPVNQKLRNHLTRLPWKCAIVLHGLTMVKFNTQRTTHSTRWK